MRFIYIFLFVEYDLKTKENVSHLFFLWFLVLYFSFSPESVSLTTYVTEGGSSFFHFPPGGVHKQKGW